jgi:hypothetical protein
VLQPTVGLPQPAFFIPAPESGPQPYMEKQMSRKLAVPTTELIIHRGKGVRVPIAVAKTLSVRGISYAKYLQEERNKFVAGQKASGELVGHFTHTEYEAYWAGYKAEAKTVLARLSPFLLLHILNFTMNAFDHDDTIYFATEAELVKRGYIDTTAIKGTILFTFKGADDYELDCICSEPSLKATEVGEFALIELCNRGLKPGCCLNLDADMDDIEAI